MNEEPGAPDPRAARVRSIADRVSTGSYRVDALDVADAILRDWMMEDLIDAAARQSNDGSGTSSSSD